MRYRRFVLGIKTCVPSYCLALVCCSSRLCEVVLQVQVYPRRCFDYYWGFPLSDLQCI